MSRRHVLLVLAGRAGAPATLPTRALRPALCPLKFWPYGPPCSTTSLTLAPLLQRLPLPRLLPPPSLSTSTRTTSTPSTRPATPSWLFARSRLLLHLLLRVLPSPACCHLRVVPRARVLLLVSRPPVGLHVTPTSLTTAMNLRLRYLALLPRRARRRLQPLSRRHLRRLARLPHAHQPRARPCSRRLPTLTSLSLV